MTLADAEKTRLLAEGVMGWHSRSSMWCDDTHNRCQAFIGVWDPLHNESHAADVRERMRELGWRWEILTYDTYDRIRIEHREVTRPASVRVGPGAIPRGTCHAALLALGLAKEDEL